MVIKNIIFINTYNAGDIYIPSKFIEDFACKLKNQINIAFAVNCSTNLLKLTDVTIISCNDILYNNNIFCYKNEYENDVDIYYNIWVGCLWNQLNLHGIYLDIIDHYLFFKNVFFDKFNLKMENIEYYIPENNTEHKNKINLITNLNNYKKILICNGFCNSKQVENFSFNLLIEKILDKFNDIQIYITHKNLLNKKFYNNNKILFIDDYFKIPNLNEIAEFAKNCDYIIGRDSGLFYWCQNKGTLNKNFICFSEKFCKIYEKFNVTLIRTKQKNNDIELIFQEAINNINLI
jgi:hypothetical protein